MSRHSRHARRLLAMTGVLAVLLAACTGGGNGEDDGEDPQATPSEDYCEGGGTAPLRWVHEQEPEDLHVDAPTNGMTIAGWIQQGMLEGLYGISADARYVPELLAEEVQAVENADGTVTYHHLLRNGLRWSDGVPITGETVRGTYDLLMEGYDLETGDPSGAVYAMISRDGYSLIDPDSWEIDGQAFSYTSERFYAGYPSLFNRLLPVHVLDSAATANEALASFTLGGEPLPASGPFQFERWDRGVSLTLTTNPSYHGANPANDDVANTGAPCVPGVEIVWVDTTDGLTTALLGREADLIFSAPQVTFGPVLGADSAIVFASEPGPAFEHWSLNTLNPHLADPNVREALAYTIDKSAVMEALYTPLFGDVLPPNGLGSAYWLASSANYVDHQGAAGYGRGNVDAAAALLEESGYSRDSGVWEHPERGPLTLRTATTGGDELRELQQQLLQEQLNDAGWDVRIDNATGGAHFGQQVFAAESVACNLLGGVDGEPFPMGPEEVISDCGRYDISQFSFVGGPWPGSLDAVFRTGSPNNLYRYYNPSLDAVLDRCGATMDEDERAACYNEADRYVTTREIDDDGLVIIPLTQKPQFYAWSNATLRRAAVAVDATEAGPLVHGADFLTIG